MKIYTKTGDKGSTALIGGRRVPKDHPRIEAYGTVDELMSFTALLMDTYDNQSKNPFFHWILDRLMTIASLLASDGPTEELPQLTTEDVQKLEQEIDRMEEKLPELKSFVLPGGHPVVSLCHVCRTVCRRAERTIIAVTEKSRTANPIIRFLNRYSDYLFVLSRLITKELGIKEITWKPTL